MTNDSESPQELLKPPKTSGYEAIHHYWWRRPRDLPAFTFQTAQAMLLDPTVRLGLRMRSAPLAAAEIAYQEIGSDEWKPGVKADNPLVAAFVLRQLRRIWSQLRTLVTAQIWGWAAVEVTYYLTPHGTVEIDKLLPRHAVDVRPLLVAGEVCGVRFLRVKPKGHVDLRFPQCIWHTYDPEPGSPFGTPALLGAYSPWADKWLDGGGLDVRRLFMHKDAYGGVDIGYPTGTTYIEGKGEVPNRDIAREIAEQIKAGGVTTRPSQVDPTSGQEMWPLTRASIPSNPQHILQYPKDLDAEILNGLEIPDDVLTTEAGGAGWSGKRVPMAAFYCGLEDWLKMLLSDVTTQALEPLVALNFGDNRPFEVTTKPLAEQAMEQQSNAGGWAGPPQPGGPAQPPPPPARMSLDPLTAVGEGVLTAADLVQAARRVMQDRGVVRLSVDDEGNEHAADGKFAPKGQGGDASEEQGQESARHEREIREQRAARITHPNVNALIDAALIDRQSGRTALAAVSAQQARLLSGLTGLDIDESYRHVIDADHLRHIYRASRERTDQQNQPIEAEDLRLLPSILAEPDGIRRAQHGGPAGEVRIEYRKRVNGHTIVITEARKKHRELAVITIVKLQASEKEKE